MFILKVWRMAGEVDSLITGFQRLQDELPTDYRPILRPARELQASALQVDIEKLNQNSLNQNSSESRRYLFNRPDFGELYVCEGVLCGVYLQLGEFYIVRQRANTPEDPLVGRVTLFTLYEASRNQTAGAVFVDIASRNFEKLEEVQLHSSRAKSFAKEEGVSAISSPLSEERDAANTLRDSTARQACIAIKSSSGALLEHDLKKQLGNLDQNCINDIKRDLLNSNLVAAETVIICRNTGRPNNRLASTDALEKLSSLGLKCACGKPIAEELVEEALRITPLGHSLLDKSRWMTLLLVDALVKLGVTEDQIYVEQRFGGDEIDCIAIISGDVVLFELKDGEFSLGHTYSFSAKQGVVRPDAAVVITTEQIGNDAKNHFERARRARRDAGHYLDGIDADVSEPIFVEGLASLNDSLKKLAARLVAKDAKELLRDVLPLAGIDANGLMSSWFE